MKYVKEENGWIYGQCSECGQIMKFRKNDLQFIERTKLYRLPEQVECFCEEQSDVITDVVLADRPQIQYVERATSNVVQEVNLPKCPTCGSYDVEKISLGSKAAGYVAFGIFSSNVRRSYKCKNCGYRW